MVYSGGGFLSETQQKDVLDAARWEFFICMPYRDTSHVLKTDSEELIGI